MGLIGGIARTAVVAGTATAVSHRVARRQQSRGAANRPAAASPDPPGAGGDDLAAQLGRLSALRDRGQLTDGEFAAAKAKLLGM